MNDSDSLIDFSVGLTEPVIIHLQRSGTLSTWCEYVLDNWIVSSYSDAIPSQQHLLWLHNINTDAQMQLWATQNQRITNIAWHILVASCKWFYCLHHPDVDIDQLYLRHIDELSTFTYDLFDCSHSHGLAIETFEQISDSSDPFFVPNLPCTHLPNQSLAFNDCNPLTSLLSTIQPSQTLPPFYTGTGWIVLRLNSFLRPSKSDSSNSLLRLWFHQHYATRVTELITYWNNYSIHKP